jgi:hypothetical protein
MGQHRRPSSMNNKLLQGGGYAKKRAGAGWLRTRPRHWRLAFHLGQRIPEGAQPNGLAIFMRATVAIADAEVPALAIGKLTYRYSTTQIPSLPPAPRV